jgi:hypothetical protein
MLYRLILATFVSEPWFDIHGKSETYSYGGTSFPLFESETSYPSNWSQTPNWSQVRWLRPRKERAWRKRVGVELKR